MPTELKAFEYIEGVKPSTDRMATSTQHYISSKNVRFKDGFPEKIGGWVSLSFDEDNTITGVPRSIFSYKLSNYTRQLIGTNSYLYDVFGTDLTNITPLKTSTIAIANSLDTYYATLANNPITTVSGSTTITVADTAHKFKAGDTVTLSGSTAVNGVPAGDINAALFVRSVSTNSYTIIVNTAATSSGTGGGASVVRSSGIITVNSTAHGLSDGDRVKIASAADTGGVLAAQVNLEFIIRNSVTNAFDVYTAGTATSAVTGGGGASTTYKEQIDAGNADTALGLGYGMGLYGVGLYGISKTSSNTSPPRIWSHDRFGQLVISMSNDQSELYSWDGDRAIAPAPVANAPQGNYCFVSDNIAVILGAEGVNERIQWSDQGGLTTWTTGQSGEDDIEGAGKFISQAQARGENLLFTETQTYRFRYIGGQFVWQTKLLDPSIGIIAQNARVVADGVVYWMGSKNFYMWRGGNVEVVPSNTSEECTALRYVFGNMNYGQKEKIFAWFNTEFREVWYHYPSAESNNPDRVIRVNIDRFSWVIDEMSRTAAEYPAIIEQTPYLINSTGTVYLHENGFNDDGAAMDWHVETPFSFAGTNTVVLDAFIPDHDLTGSITVQIKTRDYPKSSNKRNSSYAVSATDERKAVGLEGRFFNYRISGSALEQNWVCGQWYHELKRGSPK